MIAVLMSISGATDAAAAEDGQAVPAHELGERDQLRAQRHRQGVGVAHQVLGEGAPEALVVGDGAGERGESGAVGLVERASARG